MFQEVLEECKHKTEVSSKGLGWLGAPFRALFRPLRAVSSSRGWQAPPSVCLVRPLVAQLRRPTACSPVISDTDSSAHWGKLRTLQGAPIARNKAMRSQLRRPWIKPEEEPPSLMGMVWREPLTPPQPKPYDQRYSFPFWHCPLGRTLGVRRLTHHVVMDRYLFFLTCELRRLT